MADGRQEQTRHLIVNSLFRKQVEDPKNPGMMQIADVTGG